MQDAIDKALGLVSQYNPLSIAKGSLLVANNVVCRRENIVEDRRGFALYATLSNTIKRLLTYSGRVVAHNGTVLSYDSNGSGTFADFSGSYTEPSGYRLRGVEANQNLYVTSSTGVRVLTSLSTSSSAVRLAGAPRALDGTYALAGVSGFLANNFQCAYRNVIVRKDANKNVLRGYPSQRLWVTNTAGASRNATLTLYLPSEAAAGDVLEVYRTDQVAYSAADSAGDEMGLVYQYTLVSADIAAGLITFTDSVTDTLIGVKLYTSPSQQGIAQANERPPLCKDICLFRDQFMIYANCSTKHRLNVSIVGVSALSGTTATIAGTVYTFGAVENTATGMVAVSASIVVAVAIDETARSLVKVINRYASNTTVYAYYLSGPDDLPGQIMIEERVVGGSGFGISVSTSGASVDYFPAPPTSAPTSGDSFSTNSVQKNALYLSKAGELEHVPLLNYVFAGPSSKEILRVVPLRDSVIIISQAGIYRMVGESVASMSVTPLDLTVFCKSADSVSVLANQVIMLSNQGIVSISDNTVQVLSRDIAPNIKPLLGLTIIDDYTVGQGYESEGDYIVSTVTQSTDTESNQVYVYNIFTRAWTRWTFPFAAAVVESDTDRLFVSKPNAAGIYRERKDFADTDYCDPEFSITITGISGDDVTFTISGGTPAEGWVIAQGGTEIAIDTVVSSSGSFIASMADTVPDTWAAGAATVYPPVGHELEFNSWTAAAPNMLKQVSNVQVIGDPIEGNSSASVITMSFRTNLSSDTEEVDVVNQSYAWGSGPWGEFSWGGVGGSGFPTMVPRNKQACHILIIGVTHKQARKRLALSIVGINYRMASETHGR